MKSLLVLNVVGLTPRLLPHAPRLAALAREGFVAPLTPVLPAVTCTAQTSMLTGALPREHGVVGNGWYDRERDEPSFWKQSAHLVTGERVWDAARARDAACTSANVCWWYAMYGSTDWTVTPRPAYPADGRKIPDCWTHPPELRELLQRELGPFPLFRFWGPMADLTSSTWIAAAALSVMRTERPRMTFVYLPHLDYALQKVGPGDPSIPHEVAAIDAVAAGLSDAARAQGAEVVVLSEYGIVPVTDAVFPNRALRQAGLVTFRDDAAGESLDHGASRAFAIPDHQLAHVYVRDANDLKRTAEVLRALPGMARLLCGDERREIGLDHPRSGEIVLLSAQDRWFAHDWWTDPARAPDYQRTVDIHRKPGYDPRELFLDPHDPFVKLRLARRIAARKLGFRNLLDVIPLDTSLVRGSHGLAPATPEEGPLILSPSARGARDRMHQTDVKDFLLGRLFT